MQLKVPEQLVERLSNKKKASSRKTKATTKADAKKALDAFIGATTAALKKGDRLALVGFGSSSVSYTAASDCRNPQTAYTF